MKTRYFEAAPDDIELRQFQRVIRSRRSVRKFEDTPIPEAVMDDCFRAAMLAPSSSNLQPWSFYQVSTPEIRQQLIACCMGQSAPKSAVELIVAVARTDRVEQFSKEMIKQWPIPPAPKMVKRYYQWIPLSFKTGRMNTFGVLKRNATRFGSQFKALPSTPSNLNEKKIWAAKNTALACQNLVLALRAHGFDSCMIDGFDPIRVAKLLKLNEQQFPILVIAAGKRAVDGVFHPQLRFDKDLFIFKI